MTRRHRRSSCLSAALLTAAAALLVMLRPAPAAAQACCAGGALIAPARLALVEDYAIGLQMRARSTFGAFGADGRLSSSSAEEQSLGQDLIASLRVTQRGQVGLLLPAVQTHRRAGGLDEWGGGLGDVALTGRYDFLSAAESASWPGLSLLVGVKLPTGTAADAATRPLATDATGTGTADVTLGASVERGRGHLYGALTGWVTHRFDRSAGPQGGPPVRQSFSLRWTGLAVGGYVFDNEAAVALYATALAEGAPTIDGVADPGTGTRLTTVGAAGLLPLGDVWRLQGALHTDVMISSFGRNQLAGSGLTASLIRVWM